MSAISFNEKDKTFRLYFGNSLYAFCITPELSLEHLYWGKSLNKEFDLRYLSQSSRMLPFLTSDETINRIKSVDKIDETLETLQEEWQLSTISSFGKYAESETIKKKRLENIKWRKMAMKLFATKATSNIFPTIDIKPISIDDSSFQSTSLPVTPLRRRAVSNAPISMAEGLRPPSISNIRSLMKSLPSSPRGSKSFIDLKFSTISQLPTVQSIESELPRLKPTPLAPEIFDRMVGKIGKGAICTEYSDHGTGDFRSPSFLVVSNDDGSSISPLKYKRHRIFGGKENLPDNLPSLRIIDPEDATTLIITMGDVGSGVEVDLVYVSIHKFDVLTRRTVFRNSHITSAGKIVQKASSVTLDFESTSTPFHLVQLSGSWARERYIIETKLTQGIQSIGSTRGVSGHQHNPFAAITIGPPNETQGEVKGFSLVYSGNFLFEADLSELGRLRINMGIHPMGFQWHLASSQEFFTPETILVRSSEGLGGMSRTLHRLFLDHLIPANKWSNLPPPILLNTWEAKYFDVNHENIIQMARKAVSIGVDMIVVDDGWFGERNSDTTSLGDWFPNGDKFPHGLKALVDEVNQVGCKFGLWFEFEMVSEKSTLYKMHPDWCLSVPNRPKQIGRNQFVLDLTRQSVIDYLFETVSKVLHSANVEYIKCDMNRPLTEVYSQRGEEYPFGVLGPVVWQSESSHRYVQGLYQLQNRLSQAFPHILIENCASGGGRFDPGMLYFGNQIWCSDNTDAITRMRIQYGTSLVYPSRCVGAHVSSVPNHITGNYSRSRTRSFVAMWGTYGFELDICSLSPSELNSYKEHIVIYKTLVSPIIRNGDLYRLWDPFKVSLAAWMYVSRDKERAVVFAFSMNSDHWSNLAPRLMLQGLLPDSIYEITEPLPNNMTQSAGNLRITETEISIHQLGASRVRLSGDVLMFAGLPIKFYTLDDSLMFYLVNVGKCVQRKNPTSFQFGSK